MSSKCPHCGVLIWYMPGTDGDIYSPPDPPSLDQFCDCEISQEEFDQIEQEYLADQEWPP